MSGLIYPGAQWLLTPDWRPEQRQSHVTLVWQSGLVLMSPLSPDLPELLILIMIITGELRMLLVDNLTETQHHTSL